MKVIINKCWGGFGVSTLVLKELVMSNSNAIQSYTPKSYYGGDNEKYKSKENWEEMFNNDYPSDYKDIGDGFMGHRYGYHVYKDGLFYDLVDDFENRHAIRSHPDLIRVVERLGNLANGPHGSLSVVEIPDDVEYEIEDYDGMEHIAEKHRTWS